MLDSTQGWGDHRRNGKKNQSGRKGDRWIEVRGRQWGIDGGGIVFQERSDGIRQIG